MQVRKRTSNVIHLYHQMSSLLIFSDITSNYYAPTHRVSYLEH